MRTLRTCHVLWPINCNNDVALPQESPYSVLGSVCKKCIVKAYKEIESERTVKSQKQKGDHS